MLKKYLYYRLKCSERIVNVLLLAFNDFVAVPQLSYGVTPYGDELAIKYLSPTIFKV